LDNAISEKNLSEFATQISIGFWQPTSFGSIARNSSFAKTHGIVWLKNKNYRVLISVVDDIYFDDYIQPENQKKSRF
jgi:hypothetical protein